MEKLKEVFEKAIPVYKDAIDNLPDYGWKSYLGNRYLDMGICHYSNLSLSINITHETTSIQQGYWYKKPLNCKTKSEAIDCLQWRVKKMEVLLNEWQ